MLRKVIVFIPFFALLLIPFALATPANAYSGVTIYAVVPEDIQSKYGLDETYTIGSLSSSSWFAADCYFSLDFYSDDSNGCYFQLTAWTGVGNNKSNAWTRSSSWSWPAGLELYLCDADLNEIESDRCICYEGTDSSYWIINVGVREIESDSDLKDQYQDDLDRVDQDGDDLSGALDDAANGLETPKPDLDDIDMDIVPDDGLNSLNSVLSVITSYPLFLTIMVMAATLMMVSYIFFGKRG